MTTGKTIALTRWTFVSQVMEKAVAPHSSTLAWKIPWMEEPDGLQSMGHKESDMTAQLSPRINKGCCPPDSQYDLSFFGGSQ